MLCYAKLWRQQTKALIPIQIIGTHIRSLLFITKLPLITAIVANVVVAMNAYYYSADKECLVFKCIFKNFQFKAITIWP